jgi:hypothetical protein
LFSGAETAGPGTGTSFGANAWYASVSFLPSRSVAASASSRIAKTRARSAATRASPGASAAAFSASATAPSNADAAARGEGAPQRRVRRARVDGERSLRDARSLLRVPALERARADVHQALEL